MTQNNSSPDKQNQINYDQKALEGIKFYQKMQQMSYKDIIATMQEFEAQPAVIKSFFNILRYPEDEAIKQLQAESSPIISDSEVINQLRTEAHKAFDYISTQSFPDMLGDVLDPNKSLTAKYRRSTCVIGMLIFMFFNFFPWSTLGILSIMDALHIRFGSSIEALVFTWFLLSTLMGPALVWGVSYFLTISYVNSALENLKQLFQERSDWIFKKYHIKSDQSKLKSLSDKERPLCRQKDFSYLPFMLGCMIIGHLLFFGLLSIII